MEGFEVMSALAAAPLGEVFITVTGAPDVLRREHFERMRDGAVLANAGHFDVEIDLAELRALAGGPAARGAAAGRRVRARRAPPARRRQGPRRQPRRRRRAPGVGHGPLVRRAGARRRGARAERARERAPGRPRGRGAVDQEVARLKLASLGIEIDVLSEAQERYLRPFR